MICTYQLHIAVPLQQGTPGLTKDYRQIHALFFRLLYTYDAKVATTLHAMREKPFSLWISQVTEDAQIIEVTVYSQLLQQVMQELVSAGSIEGVLGKQPVEITAKRRGVSTFDLLWENAAAFHSISRLKVEFLTPTSFRRNGLQLLFPEPNLLFKGVYTKAVTFGNEFLRDNLLSPEGFADNIRVSRYNLETKEENYGKYKIIGCAGQVIYDCRLITIGYMIQSLAFLSQLAELTGIGYKTTMGMGKVRCTLR